MLFYFFSPLLVAFGILWDFWICGLWSFTNFWKFSSTISLNHSLSCSLLLLQRLQLHMLNPLMLSPNSWILLTCLLFVYFTPPTPFVSVCMISLKLSSHLLILPSPVASPLKSSSGSSSSLILYFLFIAFPFDTLFYGRRRWPSYNHIRRNQLNLWIFKLWI